MSTRPGSACALLVIDMQVGVMSGCADADGTVARANAAVERARSVGVPVIWVQDEQDFPRHSPYWELAPPLAPAADETRIYKAYRDAFACGTRAGSSRSNRTARSRCRSDYRTWRTTLPTWVPSST